MFLPLAFWTSAFLLFYIYLGYPLLMWVWAMVRPRPFRRGEVEGTVSVILAAYNEAPRLAAKIASLRAADPKGRIIEILIGSDGSTDDTVAALSQMDDPLVRLFPFPERRGKPSVLNDLAGEARGGFLVFTDARQELADNAIEHLLGGFADPEVGVISGELNFREASVKLGVGVGLGAYWRYEKCLRKNESLTGSVPGATGALYALRRPLFAGISPQCLLDDVAIPMLAIGRGGRCVFEPRAIVYDDVSASPRQESVRKRRTLAGCFQLVAMYPKWSFPGGHPIWFRFLSHKICRLASPWLLATLLSASICLVGLPLYRLALGVQVLGYAGAALGIIRLRGKAGAGVFALPLAFVSLNWDTIMAACDAIRGRYGVAWSAPSASAGKG